MLKRQNLYQLKHLTWVRAARPVAQVDRVVLAAVVPQPVVVHGEHVPAQIEDGTLQLRRVLGPLAAGRKVAEDVCWLISNMLMLYFIFEFVYNFS